MITASERLLRMPAAICGAAAGRTSRRIRSCHGMPYERAVSTSVGSIPRTPSTVFSSTGKKQKKAMNEIFCRFPIECRSDDRDRQQRRRRHRAPVLEVRHRHLARKRRRARAGRRARSRRRRRSRSRPRSVRGSGRRARRTARTATCRWNSTRIVDRRGNLIDCACTVHSCQAAEDRERDGELRRRPSRCGRRAGSRARPTAGTGASGARAARACSSRGGRRRRGSRWRARARTARR